MFEPKAPTARNGPNTGSIAPVVRRRVNKKNWLKGLLEAKKNKIAE